MNSGQRSFQKNYPQILAPVADDVVVDLATHAAASSADGVCSSVDAVQVSDNESTRSISPVAIP
jgi:hypothetical protein